MGHLRDMQQDIIGLDANVIIDMVESVEFKEEIRAQVEFNVLQLYTTSIALGEARQVLIRKRNYTYGGATESIQNILREF